MPAANKGRPLCASRERRGRSFINAAHGAKLPFLVFYAALDASHGTGVGHFDSKHRLINELVESGLDHRALGPRGFMENLLFPQTLNGLANRRLTTPFDIDVKQALVAVDDIGRFAPLSLSQPPLRALPLFRSTAST